MRRGADKVLWRGGGDAGTRRERGGDEGETGERARDGDEREERKECGRCGEGIDA